jgi:hypothetical protein
MHVVVNVLHFSAPVDVSIFTRGMAELETQLHAIDGFGRMQVVHSAPDEAILLITADSAETLDRIATEVGGPWMRANIVPLLASPPDRRLGPVVAAVADS